MKTLRIIALLAALLLAISVTACAAEEDYQYEGDAPLYPTMMLRSDPDAGCIWSADFDSGDIAEVVIDYLSMDTLSESDPWNTYEGEGGYTWMRIDGRSAGIDTLNLSLSGEDVPISSLSLTIRVEENLDVTILSIGTDEAVLPAITTREPVCPELMLAANPVSGKSWIPDNSYIEGLTIQSEYIPLETGDIYSVTLVGTSEQYAQTEFRFARDWKDDGAFMTLGLCAICDGNLNVRITEMNLKW